MVAHPSGLIWILEILETTCHTLQVVDDHTVRPEGLFRLALPQPAKKLPEPKEDIARKLKVDNKSLDHVSNVDVKVSKTLNLSNDCVAGRLKQFSSQWQNITSDHFILDSMTQYKIEFAAGFPQQEAVPREIGFSLQQQHIIQNEIDNL